MKLVVCFPGIGYHCDKPLLYYSRRLARADREVLVQYAKQYMKTHPNVDYFMFGHRHIELDLFLSKKTRMMILGDWITQFTYAVFDGEHMFLEEYVEGESQP